jgi:glutaredoxin
MVVLIGTLGVYANVKTPVNVGTPGEVAPPVTTPSNPSQIALAQHLKQIGAKMYTAYWCPHCYEQKQLFGQEAVKSLNLVECDPQGRNAQPKLCQEKGIQGFPTWEINGKLDSGAKPLEKLAQLSGYSGPTNFPSLESILKSAPRGLPPAASPLPAPGQER